MERLHIHRFYWCESHILGLIYLEGKNYPLYTLEPPFLDNKKNESCIPTGTYGLVPYDSSRLGKCFLVKDVPNRTDILIHVGNFIDETTGCILVGTGVWKWRERNGSQLLNSRDAMNFLLSIIIKPIVLHISNKEY